jgi:hypothetical protein
VFRFSLFSCKVQVDADGERVCLGLTAEIPFTPAPPPGSLLKRFHLFDYLTTGLLLEAAIDSWLMTRDKPKSADAGRTVPDFLQPCKSSRASPWRYKISFNGAMSTNAHCDLSYTYTPRHDSSEAPLALSTGRALVALQVRSIGHRPCVRLGYYRSETQVQGFRTAPGTGYPAVIVPNRAIAYREHESLRMAPEK